MKLFKELKRGSRRQLNVYAACLRYLSNQSLSVPVEPVFTLADKEPVPESIPKPNYVISRFNNKNSHHSFITATDSQTKSEETIGRIRKACRLGRRVLNHLALIAKVGVSTNEIDYVARKLIIKHGAYPSPLGYKGFPKSICTSVNNVVVHGIPDSRILADGDIVNIDVTVFLNGVHGDLSETFCIGNVDDIATKLVQSTRKCLDDAIAICKPGQRLNAIGKVISEEASKNRFSICPYFVGHGIGKEFHEAPQIIHHANIMPGMMQCGMVFTIEPVLCEGTSEIRHWEDGWTVVTMDSKRAAQFEETVCINKNGVEVLTANIADDNYLQPGNEGHREVMNLLDQYRSLVY